MKRKISQVVLTENERAVLNRIAEVGNRYEMARARLFLLADKGINLEQIAEEINLSRRRSRYWLRRFVRERLDTFNERLLAEVQVVPAPNTDPKTKRSSRKRSAKVAKPPVKALAESPSKAIVASPPETAEKKEESMPTPEVETDEEKSQTQTEDAPEIASPKAPPKSAKARIEVIIPLPPDLDKEVLPDFPPMLGVDKPRLELNLDASPGVTPDDPMSEAGRKVLFYHFERMLWNEPGTRQGEDPEALHDMRVATRRLRSAFRVFRDYYRRKTIRPFIRNLRATRRALGPVRDLDVFVEKIDQYQAGLPEDERGGMEPLLESWKEQREEKRVDMMRYLNSTRFAHFITDFADFLTKPGAGARRIRKKRPPTGYLVRHVTPRLVYAQLEAVRSYDTVLDHAPVETLHALRIKFKRFRYTLEFFQEVLGPEAETVIEEVKIMQDHLGDLNDANIASQILQTFIANYEESQAGIHISERRSIDRIIQYMASCAAEKHRLIVTFPEAWANFNRLEVREHLALAVAAL